MSSPMYSNPEAQGHTVCAPSRTHLEDPATLRIALIALLFRPASLSSSDTFTLISTTLLQWQQAR